ncbi:MAG: NAD(P)H-hydrate dehydratase [Candidatus Thorarchaeota archaeon]|nr:MAG: NAD(P)H-hydrate dehydratase [Candidatus Thorarchaeota archaeon]
MQDTPIDSKHMRILELNSQYLGVDLGMLMQQAGREVARVIEMNEDLEQKWIIILCGGGGNGGDGMVAARHLLEVGANVEVYLLGSESDISSPDTRWNWEILDNLHGIPNVILKTESEVKSCKGILEADLLVDALLGFGLKSRVREPLLTAVKMINKSEAKTYSIDVPTGLDSDTGKVHGTVVKADATITLHAPKPGLMDAEDITGTVYVVPIGIPPEAERLCGPGDLWLFNRPRHPDSRKGDNGRILVIGGSDVYSGAPALAGMAALRSGADLVTVVAPDPVVPAIRAYSPNLMVRSLGTRVLLSESLDMILDLVKANDVVALGPGLGLEPGTSSAVLTLVESIVAMKKPLVIDADGLKSLANSGIELEPTTSILTPHWSELAMLLDESHSETPYLALKVDTARMAAEMYNAVILLKGPIDVVVRPEGAFKLNRTGVPAMTVGGTGDVLTGICAALLAQKEESLHCASAAAFVSGIAGELAFEKLGNHILATDVIEMIPNAMSGISHE